MQNAWLIVGLGNPGREYEDTRHNAGYKVVEALARRWKIEWAKTVRHRAQVARVRRAEKQVILCRPITYMNASGEAVVRVAAYYKVPPSRVVVVVDDADLPLGEIRMRPRGSSAGHHGLESVEQHMATREYTRLRVGIGRRADGARQITDYVLSSFRSEEKEMLGRVLDRASDQVECWLDEGPQQAMNRFNGIIEN